MKRVLRSVLLKGVVCLLGLGINTAAIAQTGGCTRKNLKGITNEFLTALVAHSPARAPLAANVRYTEDGIVVPIGKGVWQTATKLTFKRGMVDTEKCGTYTQTILDEKNDPKPVLYGVRLRVQHNRITEIEAIVVRGKQVLDAPAIIATRHQDWEAILPPEQRSSRLAMMAAADDYFRLFVKKQKREVSDLAFSGFCDRWENGMRTTKGGKNKQGVLLPRHHCSPEGFADMAHTHGPRRFLVDTKTGVVVAFVLFDGKWPDAHMFRMINGKVVWIQAYFEYSKAYKTIGWPVVPPPE